MESNPNDLNFTWKFNNTSTESIDLPASLIAVDRAKSIAHYTPMVEQVSAQNKNASTFLFVPILLRRSFGWKTSTEITLLFFIPSLAKLAFNYNVLGANFFLLFSTFFLLLSLSSFSPLAVMSLIRFAVRSLNKKKYIKRMHTNTHRAHQQYSVSYVRLRILYFI